MTPTATLMTGLDMAGRPVARELASHPSRAGTSFQRPLQGFGAGSFDGFRRATVCAQPVIDDVQVVVLLEGVEGQPEAETLGERNLFFDSFARMDLAVGLMLG